MCKSPGRFCTNLLCNPVACSFRGFKKTCSRIQSPTILQLLPSLDRFQKRMLHATIVEASGECRMFLQCFNFCAIQVPSVAWEAFHVYSAKRMRQEHTIGSSHSAVNCLNLVSLNSYSAIVSVLSNTGSTCLSLLSFVMCWLIEANGTCSKFTFLGHTWYFSMSPQKVGD